MTLNTSIAIGKPYNVHELFAFCQKLLGTPESVEPQLSDGGGDWRSGQKMIGNPGGIGLAAWLQIWYGVDGPFLLHEHDEFCSTELGGEYGTTQEQIDEHTEWVAKDPTENGWTAIEVSFDTAYSYREGGESCSDLHARLVTALGHWLDERGLPWKWRNEYTGEWFDRYDHLDEFGDEHQAIGADDWFRNLVLPAIERGAL